MVKSTRLWPRIQGYRKRWRQPRIILLDRYPPTINFILTSHWTQSPHISTQQSTHPSLLCFGLKPIFNFFGKRGKTSPKSSNFPIKMAAATAVASSFSTTVQNLKCLTLKTWHNDHPHSLHKISYNRISQAASLSCSLGFESNIPIGCGCKLKWRIGRVAAAVAHEEAALTGEDLQSGGVAAESGGVSTKLYFGNLPYNIDSAQLAGIIQEYASPELVEVLYDRNTGKSRGFAFVTMSTIEECNTVIKNLDGSEYNGRNLRVNFSDKPKPKEPLYPETEHKLFVGNLSWSVTSESLAQAFQEYGRVAGARVLYDGETGRSRGYGFVCYETKAEMETALQSLNGVELEGRAIRVSLAQGKKL